MNDITPEFVLPTDLLFLKATDVEPNEGIEETDIILERPRMRSHSKLVSADFAALITEFRQPTRIPMAIAKFARNKKTDPRALFEETISPLLQLVEAGFIVQPDEAQEPLHRFQLNQTISSVTLLQAIRRTEDTEVYLACDNSGRFRCVKTLGPQSSELVKLGFETEIEAVTELSGKVCPQVIDIVEADNAPVIISEWIDGQTADMRFAHLRNGSQSEMHTSVVRIVEAFDQIHCAGFLHGDVRASNLLFDWSGRVWVIDFGLSGRIGFECEKLSFELSSMEPEAAPFLKQKLLPRLTQTGEQYGLGMVIAELVTGKPPRKLSSLRSEALDEIEAAEELKIEEFPCLSKATAPKPSDRFGSMSELADQLRSNKPSPANPCANEIDRDSDASIGSVDASVLHLAVAVARSDAEALFRSDQSIRLARGAGYRPFETASPLHNPLGGACQGVKVSLSRGDFQSARHNFEAMKVAIENPPSVSELFTGRAGYLALAERTFGYAVRYDASASVLKKPIQDLREVVSADLADALLRYKAGSITHLGIAHGLAGLCYSLLLGEEELSNDLCQALQFLVGLKVATPWGMAWPGTVNASNGSDRCSDFTPGWCNGSAGFLALWLEAGKRDSRKYRYLIEGSARYTCEHPDRTANICCGIAGRSLLLRRSGMHLNSAKRLSDIANAASFPPDAPDGSLFRGRIGSIYASLASADFPI